jgi:hypothetical protein
MKLVSEIFASGHPIYYFDEQYSSSDNLKITNINHVINAYKEHPHMTMHVHRLKVGEKHIPDIADYIGRMWSNAPFAVSFGRELCEHSVNNCVDFRALPLMCLQFTEIEVKNHTEDVFVECFTQSDTGLLKQHREQAWMIEIGNTPCLIFYGQIAEMSDKQVQYYKYYKKAYDAAVKRDQVESRKKKRNNEISPPLNIITVTKAQSDKLLSLVSRPPALKPEIAKLFGLDEPEPEPMSKSEVDDLFSQFLQSE